MVTATMVIVIIIDAGARISKSATRSYTVWYTQKKSLVILYQIWYADAQIRHMKRVLYLITLMLMFAAAPVEALQLSEIKPTLTRIEADRTISKDYTYKVLVDFTVRRTWTIASNKRVSLDFNPQNEKLMMIMLEYGSGIDQQKAAADVRRITGAGKTKWKRVDKKKAEKYDVPVNSLNAKSGTCYAFMEMSKSNKCKRVMIYTALPDSNRATLEEADVTDSGETALGNRSGASIGKVIAEQEEKRKMTPLAGEDASPVVSSSSAGHPVVVRKQQNSRASSQSGNKRQTPLADAGEDTQSEAIVDDFEEVKVESRFSLSAIQATVGLQGVSPGVLIIGAVAVVVLLTLIGMLRGSGERKHLSRYRNRRY